MLASSQSQPHKQMPKPFGLGTSWIHLLNYFLLLVFLINAFPLKVASNTSLFLVDKENTCSLSTKEYENNPLALQENSLIAISEHVLPKSITTMRVVITGYSSTIWQTDNTPFITASGTYVRDGIVAANFLPFGTKIKIPKIYGEKIFVVEDRMHYRHHYNVDIWFADYSQARNFGTKSTYIEIVQQN